MDPDLVCEEELEVASGAHDQGRMATPGPPRTRVHELKSVGTVLWVGVSFCVLIIAIVSVTFSSVVVSPAAPPSPDSLPAAAEGMPSGKPTATIHAQY